MIEFLSILSRQFPEKKDMYLIVKNDLVASVNRCFWPSVLPDRCISKPLTPATTPLRPGVRSAPVRGQNGRFSKIS